MNRTTIRIDPRTWGLLKAALATLPQKVGTLVVRKALNAWGGVVKRAEIAAAKSGPSDLIPKSIIVDVKVPQASFNIAHHGKPPSVSVGPSRRFVKAGTTTGGEFKALSAKKREKVRSSGRRIVVRRPSRYAHFVEAGIAGTKHVTPHPFVAPAVEVGASAGMAAMSDQLSKGIAAEAAKLAKG